MHALQMLPLFALALGALAGRFPLLADETVRTRLALVAGGDYSGLTGLVTWQAMRGQPLIHPDGATLAGAAALVIAAVAGLGWSAQAGRQVALPA